MIRSGGSSASKRRRVPSPLRGGPTRPERPSGVGGAGVEHGGGEPSIGLPAHIPKRLSSTLRPHPYPFPRKGPQGGGESASARRASPRFSPSGFRTRRSGAERQLGLRRRADLDVDLERRDRAAALHLDLDLVAIDGDVLRDHGEDLLAQDRDEVGAADGGALMRQQELQALAGDRRRAAAAEEREHVHAALRVNSLPKKRFLSFGTTIFRVSPMSRRAAS